ncbi:hypothetical protein [Streptomyces pinistramenti]|uniref:hypothetical protein n=1 Tax=Streptomyces pinistramenti TaxID=2884812 RepID=UPI001D0730E5|nr:hypothetical protein [Streptomyces pinistramenti]MCB5909790.1 hypothetical protein [Streptomyces pinistramenti]
MTQSGQGHDPQNSAAGPAREGVVLPANGEPWVPAPQAAPSAGQPWGQPWGPDQQAPQQPYGQGQDHGQSQGYGQDYGRAPMPQQPYQPQPPGFPPLQAQPPVPPLPPAMPPQPQAPGTQISPQTPGQLPPPAGDAEATALIPPFGAQGPHGQGGPGAAPSGALPPEGQSFGGQHGYGQQPPQPYGQQAYDQHQPFGQPQQPHAAQPPSGRLEKAAPQPAAPMPPAAGDAEATALIPPIGAHGGPPGAAPLPPEASARPETPGESTQMLRTVKPPKNRATGQGQRTPQPPDGSEATQLIPPVGPGTPPPAAPFGVRPGAPGAPADRPTPAEFDGLFRTDSGTAGRPGDIPDATAQLPRFDDQAPPPYDRQGPGQGYGQQNFPPQGGGYEPQPSYDDDGSGGRRKRLAPVAIVGIIVVVLAGAGLGVGWALSGDDSADGGTKKETGGSSEQAAKEKPPSKPAADPAQEQAKKLDALLGDSNNSRSAVVNAVKSIRSCDKLGESAKALKSAAAQRNDLVSRLQQLPVDKIPQHAELTAALTSAWKSSAAADNHYAAWAGQVGGKKGCHKGHARNTQQTAQGTAASGTATKSKEQAAKIWNPIAQKYGLTARQPGDL